ncbi:PREDICTED: sprouty-related, EVH1 domain-containing protein 1 isoform X2 [Nicrophorus vespilloides]|uniref:Sprouty-related, EVH1 domain-containing protein 1 isoform X2 n=1 Tax=Nicrophorus vespilloides TaxID=110193 RepID=A0ABM1MSQ6_NICVS|nr:PREDICTED: sprouty-related, EVH1 domain-containing protein 1 isoform X2 [Nicrophorus vespilloides]
MTDTSEDGNYLVQVRAQVMSRDDSSGGWVPLAGGGLSNVSVRKKPRPAQGGGPESSKQKHDYLIFGRRISDESTVLCCTIKKDFEYNKVMPTFHHWKTEEKKFGLTFQTAADARAFDKGLRTAVEELLDGFADTYPQPTALQYKYEKDVGDDDVFMTLNLPQEAPTSRSSSDSSTQSDHQRRIQFATAISPRSVEIRQPIYDTQKPTGEKENYSYVQLTTIHDYINPDQKSAQPGTRRESPTEFKKGLEIETQQPVIQQQPSLPPSLPLKPPVKLEKGQRIKLRCRHCHELYSEDQNPKGACEYAPDKVKNAIDTVTCIGCAKCVSYHCASDEEGDFAQHPCDCSDDNCCKRWSCLTFLSLFVPCLWFYPPLKLCHWCCTRCGACGGRHSIM